MRWVLALCLLLAALPAFAVTKAQAYDAAYSNKAGWSTSCRQTYTNYKGYLTVFTITDQPASKSFRVLGECWFTEGPQAGTKAYTYGPYTYSYTDAACTTGTFYYRPTDACTANCDSAADVSPNMPDAIIGDMFCSATNGCEYVVIDVTDGFATSGATATQCAWTQTTAGTPECLTGYTAMTVNGVSVCRPDDGDEDGVPDIDDDFPEDPNESSDTDGDGIGDNGDHKPEDPTNGKDEDDEGGDEGDNTSTGGGDCRTAPNSTGDGILTQIAFQAWKTRCAIESAKAADGSVKVSGNGTGGAIAVAGGGGDSGLFDDLKNGGDGQPIEAQDLWGDGDGWTADEAGFGFSRSCPAPPSITLAGVTRTLDTGGLCNLGEIIGALVLLMAAAHAFYALAQS